MTRTELNDHIAEYYHTAPEYPWERDPVSAVYRHQSNRKWFALVMEIPRKRLEPDLLGTPQGEETVCVVNLKCNPVLIGSLRTEPGFYPAYHMSKASWITIALDGRADDDKIKWLLDASYDCTGPKRPKPRKAEQF